MRPCPCFSGKAYRDCCQPFHQGIGANNALALMRSRYAAYAIGLADYIIDTTHPDHPAYERNRKKWKKDILAFTRSTQFIGLDILNFTEGEHEASVTFCAHLQQAGRDVSFTEKSTFLKEQGRWYYVMGVVH